MKPYRLIEMSGLRRPMLR